MRVVLEASPRAQHKWRVTFPDCSFVDFGGRGYSDFTKHRDAARMRRYVVRHGGRPSAAVLRLTDGRAIQQAMLGVAASTSEDWSASGVRTAGFWSRWLLWSHASLREARSFVSAHFGVAFARAKPRSCRAGGAA